MEDDISKMPADQLRAELEKYKRAQELEPQRPLPPGVTRGNLTAEQADDVAQLWVDSVYARDPKSWTAAEKSAIEFEASRVLKEMGH